MNVALTRCRKGMVVVTGKRFLQGMGQSTLLGKLCRTWSRRHDTCWIDWKVMLNNSGALPGLPTPAPSRSNGMHNHYLGWRTTMPPRNLPSQTQTQTRMHQTQAPLYTSVASSAPGSSRNVVRSQRPDLFETLGTILARRVHTPGSFSAPGGSGGGGGGFQTATTADDEFPSLLPLATALDQSSTRRSQIGRERLKWSDIL